MRQKIRILTFLAATLGTLTAFTACGSSYGSNPVSPAPATTTGGGGGNGAAVSVTIASFAFSPSPLTVQAGQSVAWTNADGVAHTATADGGAFDTGVIAPGATSTPVVMNTAGTYTYHCRIHPEMVATIIVQ